MSDDQGWGDLGFRGHARLETPHLDTMAKNGLVLDRYYSASPVCSPTRASVLTGKHPMRVGVSGANVGHLPHAERTLAEIASDAGYRTGLFGKWHLGTLTTRQVDSNRGGREKNAEHFTTPAEHGFHTWFATEAKVPTFDPMLDPDSGESYGTAYWRGFEAQVEDNLAGDDSRVIVDRVEPFIRDSVAKNRPFLAVVWFHTPHLPVVTSAAMHERYADIEDEETRRYYGCITDMDLQIGRMRALLRELEIESNTLIWFGSDNGPEGSDDAPGSADPWRGRKRSLWEGGVRVPGVVEWPGRIAAGTKSATACVTSDLLPTLAPLMGAVAPADLDGVDVSPMLFGERYERTQAIAFWHKNRRSLVDGPFKLISVDAEENWQLYDLSSDPGETTDLAELQPERLASMIAEFEGWRSAIE